MRPRPDSRRGRNELVRLWTSGQNSSRIQANEPRRRTPTVASPARSGLVRPSARGSNVSAQTATPPNPSEGRGARRRLVEPLRTVLAGGGGRVDSWNFFRLHGGMLPDGYGKLTRNAENEKRSPGLDRAFNADKIVSTLWATGQGDRDPQPDQGSSPRGRGNRIRVLRPFLPFGTIPTPVGKPYWTPRRASSTRDHPRAGGETLVGDDVVYEYQGPSPRGRGNLAGTRGGTAQGGTIPARAGKPPRCTGRHTRPRDHPRAGGETFTSQP